MDRLHQQGVLLGRKRALAQAFPPADNEPMPELIAQTLEQLEQALEKLLPPDVAIMQTATS
ncbi:hypothetical protein [Methylobacterium soli]|uniref:Uncharacterized protein n=1 Tax=Methylobacterium soli TaxID=553447 RepID=A0A6L3SNA6_9HYPH|nr:hypothetical protein [Methylobacterium soli]KAB1068511.1 hypothetical protein F6X53_31660 [Methylobacterium soli]